MLDRDHFNLDKVKRRLIEYLAVRKLNPTGRGPILCFLGPPGVGKTSLGQSIASALGREFARIALGGARDEAEMSFRDVAVGDLDLGPRRVPDLLRADLEFARLDPLHQIAAGDGENGIGKRFRRGVGDAARFDKFLRSREAFRERGLAAPDEAGRWQVIA